jgi:hypothetical protein
MNMACQISLRVRSKMKMKKNFTKTLNIYIKFTKNERKKIKDIQLIQVGRNAFRRQ